MKISLNKIKSYVQIPDGISDDDLIELIGSRLVEIEEVIDLAPRYQGCYIAKVVSCEPIPETHLNLCQIDAGAVTAKFSEGETVQVVCGAPNVHAGMLAVWITPGAIVPETYGNENFRLSVRKLRGYESNGMLAGADELGLDTEHKAIAEIDPKIAKPGDELAEVFDLKDLILDVENKSLTHRPDCFGLIGFAREVAGILGVEFTEPEVCRNLSGVEIKNSASVKLEIKIDDVELCPRYSAVVLDLPKNQPSKYLTPEAVFLAKAGMRAIDPVVDLTNILMLETGQPLHAFDYDKLIAVGGSKTPKIIVRAAKDGEALQLLDGKTISCTTDDILITSNNVPVALAGAMGGKNTEVDASTMRVVLESATFSLYRLRKTQMAHGIFSEAITRFTKGQPAAMTLPVLAEAVARLNVEPLAVVDEFPGQKAPITIEVNTERLNNLLGSEYSVETIQRTLENVGFEVQDSGETLHVTVPGWRTDIHIPEDVIEEVGRLLGYDNLPLSLPLRPFIEAEVDPMFKLKRELRELLSGDLGMNELLTYSFISRSLLEKTGLAVEDSYEIVNSISPELQCFRQQIVPSLLDKVRENLKSGHENFTLYELNQVSKKSAGLTAENTPAMENHLGIVDLGNFYTLKTKVLALMHGLHLPITYAAMSANTAKQYPYLEPKRSAELRLGDTLIGAFGEVKLGVLGKFKLERVVTACELRLDALVDAPRQLQTSLKFSKFPAVERDLTVKVASDTPFGRILTELEAFFESQEDQLVYNILPVSVYQASAEDQTKNLSFHLKFASEQKTLNAAEISAIMENIAKRLSASGATVV